jgi:hypothetical protein
VDTTTHGACKILRRLRDWGLLELHPAGSQSYYTLVPRLRPADAADREELAVDRGELKPDRGELKADRGKQLLAPSLLETPAGLGSRPKRSPCGRWLRNSVWAAGALRPGWLSSSEWKPPIFPIAISRR